MNRRRFVNLFFGGSFLATLAAFLYPVISYILPSKQAATVQNKVAAAKVGELPPNTAKIFKFGSTPAILINTQDGKLLAFSGVCTHLTCTVTYETDTTTLYCPCHNGRYDLSGRVISGPPPAPLEPYIVEVAGEDIFVSKRA